MSSRPILITVNGSTKDNPCRYCTPEMGRNEDCHGICERYKTWRDDQMSRRDERQQQIAAEADFHEYQKHILPGLRRKNRR